MQTPEATVVDLTKNDAGIYSSASATALAEILEQLPRQIGGRLPGKALIVMPAHAAPPLSGDWAVYRLPDVTRPAYAHAKVAGAGPAAAVPLPFVDGAFDTICVYASILQRIDPRSLLNAIAPILKGDGVLIAVEPTDHFKFAPLPPGGAAHLMRRYLFEAGFRRVHTLAGSDRFLAFVARRE